MEKLCLLFVFAILANQALAMNLREKRQANSTSSRAPTTSSSAPVTIDQCITACPVTPEYNPICGSNNQVYSNPGRLLCAQDCGLNVRQVGPAPCPAPGAPAPRSTN